jgi:hypothetical protein
MAQLLLMAVSAAAASTLLFASLASASPLALLLAQLAPLPILIVGLGWSHWSALLAAFIAAIGMAAYFGGFFIFAFLLTIGLPAWWLSYLALLARPGAEPQTLEWYPVGRLAAWACLFGAVVTIAGLIKIVGFDGSFESTLRTAFERFLRLQTGLSAQDPLKLPGVADPGRFLDTLVMIIPPAAAATAATTNLLNLWLAGRAVQLSGRMRRPWPDLSHIGLPPPVAAGFVAAAAGSLLPEFPGAACRMIAASLTVAYVLLGLAVLHAVTMPIRSRFLLLATTYAMVAIFQWPVIMLLLIGLTDAVADWRKRFAFTRGPPAQRTGP